jgi:ribonuclease P protein component
MRSSADFASVTRTGRRARGRGLIVYAAVAPPSDMSDQPSDTASTIGLIVGRSVGGSVVRHRVARRIRAQLARRLPELRPGQRLVVRALPGLADTPSAEIGRTLDTALARLDATSSHD